MKYEFLFIVIGFLQQLSCINTSDSIIRYTYSSSSESRFSGNRAGQEKSHSLPFLREQDQLYNLGVQLQPESFQRPPSKNDHSRLDSIHGHAAALLFDMDRDGAVSAINGIGVNMNSLNRHVRNGAATGGDKMLAMCDFSGNGEIDFREVFGDGTMDPFTGARLKAQNGFIALKQVAFSAIKRFDDFNILKMSSKNELLVNVQQLRLALKRIHCDLGFVSDQNIHNLEPLGNIEWVHISNYLTDQDDKPDELIFAQKSWYLDFNGEHWGADCVWFPKY